MLTGRAKGNVASALANAVFGNLFGIFATPALLMHFFGTMIELPFLKMVMKLCNKVLLPVGETIIVVFVIWWMNEPNSLISCLVVFPTVGFFISHSFFSLFYLLVILSITV